MSVLSARSHLVTVEIEVVGVVSAAQCYGAHGFGAISSQFPVCSTAEATTAIIASSKYVEATCRVTPHGRTAEPRAGNGSCGAECFPRIGLKVRWLRRFQDLCAKLHEQKSQAKPTLIYLITTFTSNLCSCHSLCMVQTTNERLKCSIPPRDGRDRGR